MGDTECECIAVTAARALVKERKGNVELTALYRERSEGVSPHWVFELRDGSRRFILMSTGSVGRPFYAFEPSGIYGVAADMGVARVLVEVPPLISASTKELF